MQHYKIAKIYFCLAAMLFIAKPFVGFAMFNHNHSPAPTSILVKIFAKRKVESIESSSSNVISHQKKLRENPNLFSLRFCFFLAMFFLAAFHTANGVINGYLRRLLYLLPCRSGYLYNRALLI